MNAYLFGESQSRVVVTIDSTHRKAFERYLGKKTDFTFLGEVTDGKIVIDDLEFGSIDSVKEDYLSSIENILQS